MVSLAGQVTVVKANCGRPEINKISAVDNEKRCRNEAVPRLKHVNHKSC